MSVNQLQIMGLFIRFVCHAFFFGHQCIVGLVAISPASYKQLVANIM